MSSNVSMVGRLTKDPEAKQLKNTLVSNFSLAVNEGKEEVNYIECSGFGKTAEIIQSYCKKGKLVFITGRLKQETWEQEGNKRSKLKVIVNSIKNLESKESKSDSFQDDFQDDNPPF